MTWPAPKIAFPLAAVATVLIALLAAVPALAAGEARIAVLISHDAPPFAETLSGFKEYLGRQGTTAVYEVFPLEGGVDQGRRLNDAVQRGEVKLILALGSVALEAGAREAHGIPIIAGMVMREEDIRKLKNATGVFLEIPIETQLEWLRRLLPEARRVGVVFNPAENRRTIEAAEKVAKRMGLELIAQEVAEPQDLPGALESLVNRADVLWGISDTIVVTPQTAKNLLLFSFRNRIPFIGLSTAWVKAGALYALDRDYRDLGRQCAELAMKVSGGVEAGSLPPIPPRRIVYSLNLKTAEQMKLEIPSSLRSKAEQLFQEEK